jgi:hypothetical protein
MNPTKRVDNKHGMNKASNEFTEHVLHGVKRFLNEINQYEGFSQIDVILDVNVENTDVSEIQPQDYENINLKVECHNFEKEHPFRLTTKHRLSIKKNFDDYDWFGYSEDDTLIFADSVKYLVENSDKLYETERKVYSIPRLVYDVNNNYFFSDIREPSDIISSVNGKCVVPNNRFGACWLYPKSVMNDWVTQPSFLNFNHPNKDGGIRVKMGIGRLDLKPIVPINDKNEPCIKCVHLGYCGKYYFPHPYKFHTLPLDKICK